MKRADAGSLVTIIGVTVSASFFLVLHSNNRKIERELTIGNH